MREMRSVTLLLRSRVWSPVRWTVILGQVQPAVPVTAFAAAFPPPPRPRPPRRTRGRSRWIQGCDGRSAEMLVLKAQKWKLRGTEG